MENFIGISRDIVKHWIYEDAEYFKVWFEILHRARFSKEPEKKLVEGKFVTVEYGQFIFGRTSWSKRLKVTERRMRTLVDKLLQDNMIELVEKYPKFTVYCVVNYAKYNHQSDQQRSHEPQGISGDVDQQNDQQATSKRPADDQQATTQEDSKELNKVLSSDRFIGPNTSANEIEQYFCQKRGKGMQVNGEDYKAISDILADGIPTEFIKASLDRSFEAYKPKHRLDEIKTFTYCAPKVYEDWNNYLEKQKGGRANEKHGTSTKGVQSGGHQAKGDGSRPKSYVSRNPYLTDEDYAEMSKVSG